MAPELRTRAEAIARAMFNYCDAGVPEAMWIEHPCGEAAEVIDLLLKQIDLSTTETDPLTRQNSRNRI